MGKWERPARPRPPSPSVGACPPPPVIRNPRNSDTATLCDEVETRGRAIMWCVGARCRALRNHAPRFSLCPQCLALCEWVSFFLKLSFAAFGGDECVQRRVRRMAVDSAPPALLISRLVYAVCGCVLVKRAFLRIVPLLETPGRRVCHLHPPSRVLALVIAQCGPHSRVPGCPLYAVQPLYFGGSQGLTIFTQHTYCERKWASLEVVSLPCSSQLSGLQLLVLSAAP